MKINFILVALAATLAVSEAKATSVTGSIVFAPPSHLGSGNGWDPANGFALPGYGNDAGTTVQVGPGPEFGIEEGLADLAQIPGFTFDGLTGLTNVDTVDFSDSSFVVTSIVSSNGAFAWHQTCTAHTAGYFADVRLTSSTYGGLTYAVAADTLTLDWVGDIPDQTTTFVADFSLAPTAGGVPEPTAWP